MPSSDALTTTLVAVILLTATASLVLAMFGVPQSWAPAAAVARAILQLALLSTILAGVIAEPVWIAALLALMFVVASAVSARRGGFDRRSFAMNACAIGAGVLVAGTVVFASGALDFAPRYVLAVGAMVLGNSMSIATLANRNFLRIARSDWGEIEAGLSLGLTRRQATLHIARRAVHESLVPAVDQTKTTGLVVLPGAFVGAIFGGLSPVEAGRFQLIVLAALLAAGAITAVAIVLWRGDLRDRPPPLR